MLETYRGYNLRLRATGIVIYDNRTGESIDTVETPSQAYELIDFWLTGH